MAETPAALERVVGVHERFPAVTVVHAVGARKDAGGI
jgi:hypothetical protein